MNTAMPMTSLHLRRLLWVAGSVALAACRGANTQSLGTPETQFVAAMHGFRTGQFATAAVDFQRLQFDLPARDTLLPKVAFYLAESHAAIGDAITAARDFRRVADDFPSDALAPFALLRVGDQYSKLWRKPELDPTHGETALATYQELIGRYPESPAAAVAAIRVRQIQEQYARKDFMNGLFYFRRGGFDSAILYFRALIAAYPGSSMVPEAYVKLVEAYRNIGYREEREETCAHLRQYFGGRADVRAVCGDGSTGR
jgi:outer membrane protein assembly factor BamD